MNNLLVLTSTFPRWLNDTMPPFVALLSSELAKYNTVDVLAPHCSGAKESEELLGCHVYRFRYAPERLQVLAYGSGVLSAVKRNPFAFLLVGLYMFCQAFSIVSLCRARKYQAVHAHWWFMQGFLIVLLRSIGLIQTKILITLHGGDLYSLNGWFFRRLRNWTLRRADSITVVSGAMKQCLLDDGIAADKIYVAPMGVDLQGRFLDQGRVRDDKKLIFVGRLVEKKGVDYLIDAMRILLDSKLEIKLQIVGDGVLKDSLKRRAERLGVAKSIEFVGAVSNDAVIDYLNQATIFVFPAIVADSGDQEGLGLVMVEALGCGCAVIASDLSAIRDVIEHDENGLLLPQKDPRKLAEVISGLLEDQNKLHLLQKRARSSVLEKFDWSIVGKKYQAILEPLCSAS